MARACDSSSSSEMELTLIVLNPRVVGVTTNTKTEAEEESVVSTVAHQKGSVRPINKQLLRLCETQRTPVPAHLQGRQERERTISTKS